MTRPPSRRAARVVTAASDARAACDAARARGERVGFVATMGALHDGHVALARDARQRAGFVVVSIFVNPTQFGPSEDFARYPRDVAADVRTLSPAGVDLVFAPPTGEMYPAGDETRVRVGPLAEWLEGASRPGHFEGVATVVAKLFAIIGPCAAVFGRKDYQQLLVVRTMVRDLLLPVDVIGHPIVRDEDGLALSSRNAYLSPEERRRALSIVRGLDVATRLFADGERRACALERAVRTPIDGQDETVPATVDYVEVRDADTLAPLGERVASRALLAVACRVGSTRLIDNVVLGEDPPPLGAKPP
jgi:pantoate--beta-alanine ligase